MAKITIDNPEDGQPEQVHLTQAEQDHQQSATTKTPDRTDRHMAIAAIAVVAILLIGLWQEFSDTPYQVRFYPSGQTEQLIERTHWLRKDGWMRVSWNYDPDYQETGWCVWASKPNEQARWHLVLRADGETLMPTYAQWWKN